MIFGIYFLGFLYGLIFLCHLLAPQVDFNLFPISEFGRISESAIIFNIGMILAGVLSFMYLKAFIKILNLKDNLKTIFYIIFSIPCVGLFLVGLFPLSINIGIHQFGWKMMSIGLSIAMFLFGILTRKQYKAYSICTSILSVVGYGGLLIVNNLVKGYAIVELYFLAIISIWIIYSFFFFRNKDKTK